MAKEKTIDILVTATIEVKFKHKVTESQFKDLMNENLDIEDIVDDSVPYRLASTEGSFDYEWDYAPVSKKSSKKKKK